MSGTGKMDVEEGENDRSVTELRVVFVGPNRIVDAPAFRLSHKNTLTIGRKEDCDIHLADVSVSERHAKVCAELTPHGWIVELTDLKSTHGTQVNGEKVHTTQLETGDVIKLGSSFLVFRESAISDSDMEIPSLLGRSPLMRELRMQIGLYAGGKNTVLLQGETGVGKELVAAALHNLSGRKGPIHNVNCARIVGTVADSTLFGHAKGSFTGALTDRAGVFELATDGTLFLDEVAELEKDVQSKLLRILEDPHYHRLGDRQHQRTTNARVISASHVDLEKAIKADSFRRDLYYRLSQCQIWVPPLRERREDILLIAQSFLTATPDASIRTSFAAALLQYHFPGNVRELKNIVEQALVQARKTETMHLKIAHCSEAFQQACSEDESGRSSVTPNKKEPEKNTAPSSASPRPKPTKEELEKTLNEHDGNLQRVHLATGWDRHSIRRWASRYGLSRFKK